MTAPAQPIGIFDSGVGGLSIAAAVQRLLPHEAIVYFADTAHFPYGSRSEDDVRALACAATERLLSHGVKLVVVACNTASSVALTLLRDRYPIPFVGVVPGVKPATLTTPRRPCDEDHAALTNRESPICAGSRLSRREGRPHDGRP